MIWAIIGIVEVKSGQILSFCKYYHNCLIHTVDWVIWWIVITPIKWNYNLKLCSRHVTQWIYNHAFWYVSYQYSLINIHDHMLLLWVLVVYEWRKYRAKPFFDPFPAVNLFSSKVAFFLPGFFFSTWLFFYLVFYFYHFYLVGHNNTLVVGKCRIKREIFFGPFSAIFIPGLLFSTWPPLLPIAHLRDHGA